MAQTTTRLVETLDLIEKRVELLRQQVSAAEREKSCLVDLIHTVINNKDLVFVSEGEREEIYLAATRLMDRCLTVEVQVQTPRNAAQMEALSQVERFIEDELLSCHLKSDLVSAKAVCEAFLNACLSEPNGTADLRFQAMVIDCAVEDQKKVRKRLESLRSTIEHTQKQNNVTSS